MVQIFIRNCCEGTFPVEVSKDSPVTNLYTAVAENLCISDKHFFLTSRGGSAIDQGVIGDHIDSDGYTLDVKFRAFGGIDFQHREGSKIGSGGQMSESQAALERKERLRKLALETIDITKDVSTSVC